MASMKLLLAVGLCLAVSASAQSAQLDPTKYTCPVGWVPYVASYASVVVTCGPDPCFGACPGSPCTVGTQGISGLNFLTNTCTCKAGTQLTHIPYQDFCYVPGTEVCNPNPCKNGGTCGPDTRNPTPGTYACTCPSNFFGRNCDVKGPVPSPTPKGLPTGGGDPYTTF